MQSNNVIFEDRYCRITNEDLTLFWYYFPFAQSKVIKFSEIRDIKLEQLQFFYGKYRLWGMDLRFHWYPCDMHRFQKTQFLCLDIGSKIKPSFTSENINQIFEILIKKIKN